MNAQDWIEFGILGLAISGALVGIVRYIDSQAAHLQMQLHDKLSIGEYQRRHEDLERRVRAIERWQDHANGKARFYYPAEEENK